LPNPLHDRLLDIFGKTHYVLRGFKSKQELKISDIYKLLRPMPAEALIILAVTLNNKNEHVLRYLDDYRFVRPILNGNDLLELGIPQSELIGKILENICHMRLDGIITTRQGEVDYVNSCLKKD
jgi:tRNA nucleotidyltransferase (CCA-adding enzyme)